MYKLKNKQKEKKKQSCIFFFKSIKEREKLKLT